MNGEFNVKRNQGYDLPFHKPFHMYEHFQSVRLQMDKVDLLDVPC